MKETYSHCQYPPCGKLKVIPKRMQKGLSRRTYEEEPYCSRRCYEVAHGIEDPRSPLYSSAGLLGRQGQRSA